MARRRRPPRPGALSDLAPLHILTQILFLQISYYITAVILIAFTLLVAGKRPGVKDVLDWHRVRGDVTTGWTLGLCWMLDSLITVIPILLLIARSKLVPDFALTIHFIHLIATSIYTRALPTNVFWWAVQICSSALMVSLGMWTCQWRELRPMAFGGRSGQKTDAGGAATSEAPAASEDGEGFEMVEGRGRGRGRDGLGTYDAVGGSSKEPA